MFTRDGVWYADARGGKHNLGKHSLGTRDRHQAEARLSLLDHRKAAELGLATEVMDTDPTHEISIVDGWERYMQHCDRAAVAGGVSANTKKRYRAVRDKHQRFCREHGLDRAIQITKASLLQYGKWLASKKYADRSVYLELTLLKQLNKWLVAEGCLPASARIQLPLQRPTGTDTYCYTDEQVEAMVAHCRATAGLEWMAGVIIGLATTGLRISELASLRHTDFDELSMMLSLTDERGGGRREKLGIERRTKGRRSRHVPVHPSLWRVIQGLRAYTDGRLFHGPLGGKIKPDTVRKVLIRDVIEPLKKRFPTPQGELGFEHGRVHSFRHYFVSEAFRHGASEGEIMSWVGHRDSKMVAHYRHLRPRDSHRTLQQIPFLRSPASGVPHVGDAITLPEASSSSQREIK